MYNVETDKFQGPLEVLLQLIEEQKLDINDISLAGVTEQFLAYLKKLETLDPNLLADFLIIASKLIVIKSKTLLPTLELELEEEVGSGLAQQLLQFKKFKEISNFLKRLEAKNRYSFIREATFEQIVSFYPDKTITLPRLEEAMMFLAKNLEEIIQLPKDVIKEVVSITDKIKHLQKILSEKIKFSLTETLQKKSKTEIIVTFLALLELVKQRLLTVEQEELFTEILIKRKSV